MSDKTNSIYIKTKHDTKTTKRCQGIINNITQCMGNAYYNYEGCSPQEKFCKDCADLKGINGNKPMVKRKKTDNRTCIFVIKTIKDGIDILCGICATYGTKGTNERLYCSEHGKSLGKVNTVIKYCIVNNCERIARYNKIGEKSPIYCMPHGIDRGCICVVTKKCEHIDDNGEFDCISQAMYGFKSNGKAFLCRIHSLGIADIVNLRRKKCAHIMTDENGNKLKDEKGKYIYCDTYPCFNIPTETVGKWCEDHHSDAGIGITTCNITIKRCVEIGCTTPASYNKKGQKTGLYCPEHGKKFGMINVTIRECIHIDNNKNKCESEAVYGFEGEIALYCLKHCNKKTMINIRYKSEYCQIKNCSTKASFALFGKNKAIVCSEHIKFIYLIDKDINVCQSCQTSITNTDGFALCDECCKMVINVNKKHCAYKDCTTVPYFNIKGEKTGLFCFPHIPKGVEMINVLDKRCEEEGCDEFAYYNYNDSTDTKKPKYCSEHAEITMENVKYKKCIHPDCNSKTKPLYNFPTEKNGIYCKTHGEELGMFNITLTKCQIKNCKGKTIYGKKGKRAQYCDNHKDVEPNLINLYIENKCSVKDCENEYEYFINNTKYCSGCIPKDCIDKIKRTCKYCELDDNSDYICKDCNKHCHKKEWQVVRYIKRNIEQTFIHDSSQMLNNFSKKRPDIFFEFATHCVIVEIDEYQHETYEEICECSRMSEITQAINIKYLDKPKTVVFIRFNPYKIINKNKKVHISMADRLLLLLEIMKNEFSNSYDKFQVKLIQLFYNDDFETYEQYKTDNITDILEYDKSKNNKKITEKVENKKIGAKKVKNNNITKVI